MKIQTVSKKTVQVLDLGRKNHFSFRVLEDEGMVDSPLYKDGWWYSPTDLSESTIPATALKRVNMIQKTGVPVQGFILAHEAPLLLAAPKKKPVELPVDEIAKIVSLGGKIVLGTALATLVAAMAAPLAMIGLALVGLALVDPALIVVLSDGTRIEVCSWHE